MALVLSTFYDQLRWNSPAEDMLCDQQPAEGKHEPEGAAKAHTVKLFQHCSATAQTLPQYGPVKALRSFSPLPPALSHLMNLACGSKGQEIFLLCTKIHKDMRLRQLILVRKAIILCQK